MPIEKHWTEKEWPQGVPAPERSTSYLVRLRDKHTGQSFEAAFNSMTERNLYIFETEHWAEVEKEWVI
jgi:hypothetical protein